MSRRRWPARARRPCFSRCCRPSGWLLGTAMGARPLALLFGPPAGQALLGAGVLLDALGLMWTARLVARASR